MMKNKIGTFKTYFVSLLFVGLLCHTNATDVQSDGQETIGLSAQVAFMNGSDTNNENETDLVTRGKELVDEALIPVYDMTNFFLEDIVQQRDLNYMTEKGVDFSDLDAIVDSFENDYEEWIEYVIGKISFIVNIMRTVEHSVLRVSRTICAVTKHLSMGHS